MVKGTLATVKFVEDEYGGMYLRATAYGAPLFSSKYTPLGALLYVYDDEHEWENFLVALLEAYLLIDKLAEKLDGYDDALYFLYLVKQRLLDEVPELEDLLQLVTQDALRG